MEYLVAYGLAIVAVFLVQVVILRWIFRIETQIKLLTNISNQLAAINRKMPVKE